MSNVDPITPDKGTPNPVIQGGNEGGNAGTVPEPKTFTQEELDKIVSNRVNDLNAKFEQKFKEGLATAQADWSKKAKMTQDEREEALLKEQKEALAQREAEATLRENKLFAYEKLTELKLPTTFVDFLVHAEKDKVEENITKFQQAFNVAVAEATQAKLKGTTPTDPSNPAPATKKVGKMYI